MDRTEQLEQVLAELIAAINRRWEGETEKKRANAISPRIEEAIEQARKLLSNKRKGED